MNRADSLGDMVGSNESSSSPKETGRTDDEPILRGEALGPLQIDIPQLRDESFDIEQSMGSNDEPAGPSSRSEGSEYPGTSRMEVDPFDVALQALVKIEVEEFNVFGPSEPESREKTKRARGERPKGPIPESASLMGDRDLDWLRLEFFIPDEVELVAPSISDRVDEPPEGYFSLYKDFFRNTYLQFPIPGVFVRYLHRYGLSFSQLLPRSMRHLVGLFVRSRECGFELSASHLENLLEVRSSNRERMNYILSSRANRPVFLDFPNKDKQWWRYFFFVRIDEASIAGGYEHLVRRGHNIVVRRPFPDIPSDLDEVYDKLKARKTNWKKHFCLERVRRAFSLQDPQDRLSSDSSAYSPRTLEAEMSKRITFREQLLRDARKASHLQTSRVDGLVTKVVEKAPVEAAEEALAPASREVVLGTPSMRPEGSELQGQGKRSAPVDKGKGAASDASKRRKISKVSADEGKVAGGASVQGRWFSKITCAEDKFPKLQDLHRREQYEACAAAGVQYIAQMNRLVLGYESDLAEANHANSRLEYDLEQAAAVNAGIDNSLRDQIRSLEVERSDALDRAEVYEKKWEEQHSELLTLRDQVRTMKEAEANVEAELRRKILVELEDASAARRSEFRRLVGALRGDVTTRMLHHGQAENNLSLVKDLLSDQPPDLKGEKSLLEASLTTLAGSNEAFDKVIDDLECLVAEQGALLHLVEPTVGRSASQGAKTATEVEDTEEMDGVEESGAPADGAALEAGEKEGDAAIGKSDDAGASKAAGEGSQNTEEI